jgi:hypothetical protein
MCAWSERFWVVSAEAPMLSSVSEETFSKPNARPTGAVSGPFASLYSWVAC